MVSHRDLVIEERVVCTWSFKFDACLSKFQFMAATSDVITELRDLQQNLKRRVDEGVRMRSSFGFGFGRACTYRGLVLVGGGHVPWQWCGLQCAFGRCMIRQWTLSTV